MEWAEFTEKRAVSQVKSHPPPAGISPRHYPIRVKIIGVDSEFAGKYGLIPFSNAF
jgi:hypothetical protein